MYITLKDIEIVEELLEYCPHVIYVKNLELLNKMKESRLLQSKDEHRVGLVKASEEEQEIVYMKEYINEPKEMIC